MARKYIPKQEGQATDAKIVLLGDTGVGKTSIALRFTQDTFQTRTNPTIGASFLMKNMQVEDTKIKLQIWDTAGQERFRAITRGYYRGAVGALIVYDITKAQSFKNVEKWLQELSEHADNDIVIMLVGNKTDLKASREVATEDAKKFAQKSNLLYIETSALDGENINQAFQQTISAIYEKKKPTPGTKNDAATGGSGGPGKGQVIKPSAADPAPAPKKGCC